MNRLTLRVHGRSPLSRDVSDLPIKVMMNGIYGLFGHGTSAVFLAVIEAQADWPKIREFECGVFLTIEQAKFIQTWLKEFSSKARTENDNEQTDLRLEAEGYSPLFLELPKLPIVVTMSAHFQFEPETSEVSLAVGEAQANSYSARLTIQHAESIDKWLREFFSEAAEFKELLNQTEERRAAQEKVYTKDG